MTSRRTSGLRPSRKRIRPSARLDQKLRMKGCLSETIYLVRSIKSFSKVSSCCVSGILLERVVDIPMLSCFPCAPFPMSFLVGKPALSCCWMFLINRTGRGAK